VADARDHPLPLAARAAGLVIGGLVGILFHPARLRIAALNRRGFHPDVAPLFVV